MLHPQTLPTLATVVGLVYLGFLVIRNGRSQLNRLFLLFLGVNSLWLLAVSVVINSSRYGTNALLSRFTFAVALVLLMTIAAFTNALLRLEYRPWYTGVMYGGGAVVVAVTLFTSASIQSVAVKGALPYPQYGWFYPVFLLYLAALILTYFFALLNRWRHLHRPHDGLVRRQLDTVAFGLVAFTLIALFTNLILPAVLGNTASAQFLPVASLVLALSFFYAISRYKLFDIRRTVVRSTTYLFLIGIFAVAFVFVVDIAGSTVTTFKDNQTAQRLFSAAVALAIAIAFQPLKRVFDRVTNRFFFRDAYVPQEFFNELNEVLVKTADLHPLLASTAAVIEKYLKTSYCVIVLAGPDIHKAQIVGTTNRSFSYRDLEEVHGRETDREYPPVLVTALLEGEDKPLLKILTRNDIALMARLGGSDGAKELGHIILGPKKSGYPYDRQDIRIMGAVANELVIAIQNALRFEQIEQFNVTLQQKIKDATHKLLQTNQKLRVLDQTKDDFISMASHQLRTPLTSVKGYVSMVLEGDAGTLTPMQRKLLNQSFVSAQRMVYLISDLLNVSRLRTGKFMVELVPTNLAALVQDEVSQLRETAESRNLHLNYHKPAHFPSLMLDDTKIRQVVMNFIDNAIYYTESGGRIDVRLVDKPQTVELMVTDSGMGVPRDEQPRLFTKFYRAPNARRARPDGTGLGLFMAKKVVIALGGAIIFKSSEGKGSTFGFSFSKAHLAKLAQQAARNSAKPAVRPDDTTPPASAPTRRA